MNITLSAEEKVVKKAREYAKRHGTSLNQEIRHYMEQLAGLDEIEKAAEEFEFLAMGKAGKSPKGFIFNREESHVR